MRMNWTSSCASVTSPVSRYTLVLAKRSGECCRSETRKKNSILTANSVSNVTRNSRSSTSVSVSPQTFLDVVLTLSVSTLLLTTICLLRPTRTCTALVVLVVLVPKVCRFRLLAARRMRRFLRISGSDSRSLFLSTPRVVLTRAPTWHN